jgi:hypothetical protein
MDNRIFQLDTQWNIIHYPEKPNGFGILIIGDERHFVDESKSFWLQNEGKLSLIEEFKEAGYTIFSSNLFGKNWGSRPSVELAQRLYQHVIRNEILNEKIHILAEGMGSLVALELFKEMGGRIRSAVFVNPILSLKLHLEQEREHKFFYKKLLSELSLAYQTDSKTVENKILKSEDPILFDKDISVKIIQILSGGRAFNQSPIYQKLINAPNAGRVSANFMVPEKKQQLGVQIIKFYKKHEKML